MTSPVQFKGNKNTRNGHLLSNVSRNALLQLRPIISQEFYYAGYNRTYLGNKRNVVKYVPVLKQ